MNTTWSFQGSCLGWCRSLGMVTNNWPRSQRGRVWRHWCSWSGTQRLNVDTKTWEFLMKTFGQRDFYRYILTCGLACWGLGGQNSVFFKCFFHAWLRNVEVIIHFNCQLWECLAFDLFDVCILLWQTHCSRKSTDWHRWKTLSMACRRSMNAAVSRSSSRWPFNPKYCIEKYQTARKAMWECVSVSTTICSEVCSVFNISTFHNQSWGINHICSCSMLPGVWRPQWRLTWICSGTGPEDFGPAGRGSGSTNSGALCHVNPCDALKVEVSRSRFVEVLASVSKIWL